MAEVGSAFVSIVPSARGFGRKLDSDIGSDLDRSGKAGSKRFGSAFGGALKSAIAPALAVIGAAAVGGLLKGAIDEASDLNETLNKSSVIFGKNAGTIERFGNTAAKSLGLSKNEAIAAASSFGDMFSQIGFGGAEAAKMSRSVVRLSADLGSFNNLETGDVAERIAAAFRGEYDSLQALIPNINAARVQSVALAATGKKTAKELTAQEKAAAVLAIVHKDGARATGDFARTSGGLANQQKILSAQTADLKAKIGAALLPVVTRITTYLNNTAVPAFEKFVAEMQNGTGTGGKVANALKDVWSAVKPIATAVLTAVKAFAGLPGASQKVLLLAAAALVLQNRFSGAVPSLQNFDRTAALATAKTVAMRGGALAAGVGLATLASSAGGAKTSLGSLATVGAGIATGFAVGGPWGAAIGGGVSVLSLFASRSQAAASAQDALDSAGKRVAATLNTQTGALTANSRAVAAKELADSGAFAAAKKMGISLRDVLDASLGNTRALYRVSAASEAWANQQAKTGKYTEKSEAQLQTLRRSIGATASSLNNQRAKIDQVNEAMGKAKDKTVKFKVESPGLFGVTAGINSLIAGIDKAVAKSKSAKSSIGHNAKGTDNWRGGLTVVGEKGPELINLAKGAQVIPNHKIGDVGSMRSVSARGSASGGITKHDLAQLLNGLNILIDNRPARLAIAGA